PVLQGHGARRIQPQHGRRSRLRRRAARHSERRSRSTRGTGMKITMSATNRCSKSEIGVGRVWEGQTEFGTPVKVLVSGLAANTDDPAMQAQFDKEHDEPPYASDGPVCPDCGQPMELHAVEIGEEQIVEHRQVKIDLYDVMVRWLMASDSEMVPAGVTE